MIRPMGVLQGTGRITPRTNPHTRFSGEGESVENTQSIPLVESKSSRPGTSAILEAVQSLTTRDTWVGGGHRVNITVANRQPVHGITTINYVRQKHLEILTLTTADNQLFTHTRRYGRFHSPFQWFNKKARRELNQAFDQMQVYLRDFQFSSPPLKQLQAKEEEAAKRPHAQQAGVTQGK